MGHGRDVWQTLGTTRWGAGTVILKSGVGIVLSAPLGGVGGYIEIWGGEGRRLY